MTIIDILQRLKNYVDNKFTDAGVTLFKPVTELPTASASTLNFIYLVPAQGSTDEKDEYITVDNGEEADPRYTWDRLGSMTVGLDGYPTTEYVIQQLANLENNLKALIPSSVIFSETNGAVKNVFDSPLSNLTLNPADDDHAGLLTAQGHKDINTLKGDINTLKDFKTNQDLKNGSIDASIADLYSLIPSDPGGDNYATKEYVDRKDEELNEDLTQKIEAVEDKIPTTASQSDTGVDLVSPDGNKIHIPVATRTTTGVLKSSDFAKFSDVERTANEASVNASTALLNVANLRSEVVEIQKVIPGSASESNKLVTEDNLENAIGSIPSAQTAIDIANQALNAIGKLSFYIANDTNEGNAINLNNNHSIVVATGSNGNDFYFVLPKASEYKGKFYILKDCRTSGKTFICITAGDTGYIYDYSNVSEEAGVTSTNNLNNDGVFIVSDGQGWRLILAISDRDL